MRGKVQPDADGCRPPGITPAYAGKSSRVSSFLWLFWDHPRVCGEKGTGLTNVTSPMGSPPRMRGKDRHRVAVAYGNRITPAYAGKRAGACARGASTRDHPRVCGEKLKFGTNVTKNPGSPPRVRGKVVLCPDVLFPFGITPACAGKRDRIGRMRLSL